MTTIPQPRPVVASMRSAFSAHSINWVDVVIWVIAIGAYFVVPTYLSLGTTVLIMILFTLSLDLAVGYGGIDTLGQGAFFGFGGYAAAFWALHVTGEPISGLSSAVSRRRFSASSRARSSCARAG
jgi:branched-chain amino acid transport system permease protein